MMDRRHCLGLGALALLAPHAMARGSGSAQLAAAWQTPQGAQVGVLAAEGKAMRMLTALDVPTRAHGIAQEPSGTLLAVARRPGDWLLRWSRDGTQHTLVAADADRAFNGHVLCSPDGSTVYTTDTNLETGAGLVSMRDGRTLAVREEWPTHGIDPHALLWDKTAPPGTRLMVANGGIEIQPETGRMKLNLDHMDSSLVRLDATHGELLGQWRGDDHRLSLRHLAWSGRGEQAALGIAMQAQHDSEAERSAAPLLAIFANDQLRVAASPRELAGYGGDIAATAEGWVMSCPRSQGVSLWRRDGGWLGFTPLAEACALAVDVRDASLWMGGSPMAMHRSSAIAMSRILRTDNHWVSLRA